MYYNNSYLQTQEGGATPSTYNYQQQLQPYQNANNLSQYNYQYPGTGKKTRLELLFPQGITLSWQVNAYKKHKDGIITKIKKRFSRNKQDDYQQQYLNYYQSYFGPQQQADNNVKQILNNVTGIVRPGQMLAIMGASGAGKTTLLNVLNFRNRGGLSVNGDIKINGEAVGWKEITEYSGYVQQLDLFIGTLTVREQLVFLAMLKMDDHFTQKEKYERVDQVIQQLNLFKCENTRIGSGDRLKGISGGEKRRLAFAAEIITNPLLLFCDEPTSGLDSFLAATIVDMLVNLAKQGKTMVCTIHQPSSQIFEKFDTLCLLSEGRVAYFGPTKEAYNFFARLGYRCPTNYNPADYYIQVLAIRPQEREQNLAKAKRICDSYESSEFKQKVNSAISSSNYYVQQNAAYEKTGQYNSSYWNQAKWLFWRETLNVLRNPIATYILIGQTIFIGIFLGLTFLQIKLDEIGVQNYKGVLFITLMQVNFGYIFAVINSLPMELPVLYREVKNRVYSVVVYYFAKFFSELPKFIITPFMLVTIIFWMSGISNNGSVYIIVTLTFILTTQVALGFGSMLSIAAPNLDVALALSIPILFPLLIFAGYFLNNDSVPNYFIWLKYISWFFYANEAVSIEFWTKIDTIPCTRGSFSNCTTLRCFKDGRDVLVNDLKINESNLARDIILLFVLFFVFRLISFIFLKIKTNRG